MQGQTSTRAPDTSMTAPLACRFSAASKDTSISTGKERDTKSGNDYFGARYYASSMGRFMSPDPMSPMSKGKGAAFIDYIGQPQNWNGNSGT